MKTYHVLFALLCLVVFGCRQHPPVAEFKVRACGFIPTKRNPLPVDLKAADMVVIDVIKELLFVSGMGQNYENRNFFVDASDSLDIPEAVVAPKVMHETDVYLHRYILYNQKQLDSLLKFVSPAAAYVLFAHELSHHLSGDNLAEESTALSFQRELSADNFAGYLCYRIHLSRHFQLSDCLKIYDVLADATDTLGYPNRERRKYAFSIAWQSCEINMQASCDAVSQLTISPVPAMKEFYRLDHSFIDSVREKFAGIILRNQAKVGNSNQTLINLRGAPVLYVEDEDKTIRPYRGPDSLSTKPLVKTTERIPIVPDKNQYIIDKANVIWARYPNGVPYIAGFAKQAVK